MTNRLFRLLAELTQLGDVITIESDWDEHTFTVSSKLLNTHVHTGYPGCSDVEGLQYLETNLVNLINGVKNLTKASEPGYKNDKG